MIKKIGLFFALISIALFTSYKAYTAYQTFRNNNIPIYDGVSYERRQIEMFNRFKGNYSLWKRKVEIPIEFRGDMHNAGFNCAVILMNPKWLANDYDVLLRAFLSIFIFSLVLFYFLKQQTSELNSLLIILLLTQFPIFYSYRYGISTYINEIPAALFLLSGYIQLLNFLRTEKTIQFITGLIFIIIPIGFRMNFFVFSSLFLIPFFYNTLLIFLKKGFLEKAIMIGATLICFGAAGSYVLYHLNEFLDYYNLQFDMYQPPSKINSFVYGFRNFKGYFGLFGLLGLFLIMFLANEKNREYKPINKLFIAFPFLIHFSFIILYLGTYNAPHVVSTMGIFFIFLFTAPSNYIHELKTKINSKLFNGIIVILLLLMNVNYISDYRKFSQTFPEYEASKNVIDFIEKDPEFGKDYKYLCLYYEVAEVPIDVDLFKKTGIWLNTQNHFYFHEQWYYKWIDKNLSEKKCIDYFINKVDSVNFNLIIINDSLNADLAQYKLASKVNDTLRKHLSNSALYKPVKSLKTNYIGPITFYKRVK